MHGSSCARVFGGNAPKFVREEHYGVCAGSAYRTGPKDVARLLLLGAQRRREKAGGFA